MGTIEFKNHKGIVQTIEFKNCKGIIHLTDEELKERADKIFDFLLKIHPELTGKRFATTGTKDVAIHIRAIFRDTDEEELTIRDTGKPYYSCYYQNIFRFNDTGKKNLLNFLRGLNNTGRAYCLYYGVHSLDDNIAGTEKIAKRREENKRFVKNSLTTKNAIGTHILVADFDHITLAEFMEVKKTFPFETIDVFSGHGFQSIVLLESYNKDVKLLEKFVFTMWEKGFDVDLVARDEARIMRMPYMFNAKEHMQDSDITWETFILNNTEVRYSEVEIFNLLDKIPTVRIVSEDIKNKANKVKNKALIEKEFIDEPLVVDKNAVDIEFLRINYPQLDVDNLKKPIQLMLQGFRQGKAEHTVMFLTNYFSEYEYSIREIQTILLTLAELNTYNYAWTKLKVQEKVNLFYEYAYKRFSTITTYNKHLSDEYGELELKEEFEFIRKNKIKISNKFFKDLKTPDMSSKKLKSDITPTAMYVYFTLVVDNFRFDKTTYNKSEISEISGLSDKTVRDALKPLIKHGYIEKDNKYNPKTSKTKEYKLKLAVHSVQTNYTLLDISEVENLLGKVLLGKINVREFQVCLYLVYKINKNIGSLILSQQNIANELLVSRTQLISVFKSLEVKGLIQRAKVDMGYCKRFVYRYYVKF